jgi:hypothetical protein
MWTRQRNVNALERPAYPKIQTPCTAQSGKWWQGSGRKKGLDSKNWNALFNCHQKVD